MSEPHARHIYIRGGIIHTTNTENTWPSRVPTNLPDIRDALAFIAVQFAHLSDMADSGEYANDSLLELIDEVGVPVERAFEAIDEYLQG